MTWTFPYWHTDSDELLLLLCKREIIKNLLQTKRFFVDLTCRNCFCFLWKRRSHISTLSFVEFRSSALLFSQEKKLSWQFLHFSVYLKEKSSFKNVQKWVFYRFLLEPLICADWDVWTQLQAKRETLVSL